MSRVYTFNKTVRGHLHVMNEFPCQDSSVSLSAENEKYFIAVIADGHGSKSCFRSDYGSKCATEVATECLKQFAEATLASEESEDRFYKDMFSNPRYRHMTIRRLTDTILAEWHDRVLNDYKNNPPTLEEMGDSAPLYEGGNNATHIYGTTLIAALQLPKCLLLIQQGDGRCDVFFLNGKVSQPIPWDERCEGTTTTSLCDEDAADSFRNVVIDTSEKHVIACFLGSDGVEDAYRDTYEELGGSHVLMGGVHTFYKDLICKLSSMEQVEFEDYLNNMLHDFSENGKFSRTGSGDDISVAGIVDIDSIKKFVSQYETDIKLYSLEEQLFWKEDELRGKKRKHGILKKRMDEAHTALEDADNNLHLLDERINNLHQQQDALSQSAEAKKAELDKYQQESESVKAVFFGHYFTITTEVQRFIKDITVGYSKKEASYREMREKLHNYNQEIAQLTAERIHCFDLMTELSAKFSDAKSAFDEYDSRCRLIAAEKDQIEKEIAALEVDY